MKLDAFISVLRDILLTKGNINVHIQCPNRRISMLEHKHIEVLDVPSIGNIVCLRSAFLKGPKVRKETKSS
jgi:hypothetical protein